MKQLLLVRHAKSDWNDASLDDFDRPLNERGKRDAPVMAKRLVEKNIKPDALISSPAKRAKKTAGIFAKELGYDKDDIIFIPALYGASEGTFFEIVSSTDDKYNVIALFSHNPGLTDFANQLTNTRVDNIPTSGMFLLEIETDHWAEFRQAKKKFCFFDFPKL